MSEESTSPERVAPVRPVIGVSPMDVSRDKPSRMAQTEAPEPKLKDNDVHGGRILNFGSNIFMNKTIRQS
ncbi:hypothetical protein PHLCEN_2v12529 [Hermanssonia centrifuga]|uniref:Uncharacterized protein n=1 Tax=Hermanssonia centrifuga TaxID=98765 RepID=A0A2R6NGZ3_9APHY|nr:hypothetical protein PHLCEN_2v12529 [Hermanssonia centrifuga]